MSRYICLNKRSSKHFFPFVYADVYLISPLFPFYVFYFLCPVSLSTHSVRFFFFLPFCFLLSLVFFWRLSFLFTVQFFLFWLSFSFFLSFFSFLAVFFIFSFTFSLVPPLSSLDVFLSNPLSSL